MRQNALGSRLEPRVIDPEAIGLALAVLLATIAGALTLTTGPIGTDSLPLLVSAAHAPSLVDLLLATIMEGIEGVGLADAFWRPLTNLYFGALSVVVEHAGWGVAHLPGLAVHAANATLVYAIAKGPLDGRAAAVAAALVLAHPLAGDVVPPIARHQDILGTFATLLAAYLLLVRQAPLAAACVAATAGAFKELYLLAPWAVAAVLLFRWRMRHQRIEWAALLVALAAPFALVGLRLLLTPADLSVGGDVGAVQRLLDGIRAPLLIVTSVLVPVPYGRTAAIMLTLALLGGVALLAASRRPHLEPLRHVEPLERAVMLGALVAVLMVPMIVSGKGAVARSAYGFAPPLMVMAVALLTWLAPRMRGAITATMLAVFGALLVRAVTVWLPCDQIWTDLERTHAALPVASAEVRLIAVTTTEGPGRLVPQTSCLLPQTITAIGETYGFASWHVEGVPRAARNVQVTFDPAVPAVRIDAHD